MLVTTAHYTSIVAVSRKNRILGASLSTQVRAMSSANKEGKPTASVTATPRSAETGARNKLVELLDIRNDPSKLGKMTVEELRTTLRSVGAPTKGRKNDLISALKILLDGKVDGESALASDGVSVDKDLKNENQCVGGINVVSESSRLQRKRKTKKVVDDDDGSIEVNPSILTTREGMSVETTDLAGKKTSVKRKLVIDNSTKYVEVSKGVQESGCESEPWTIFSHKKPQKDWIAYNPRTMRPPPLTHDTKFVKLMSWNVNGLRALLKLEGFSVLQLSQRENFDVLCLQETKLQEKDIESVKDLLEGYENSFWTCSISKLGYSGTAIISRIKPISVTYGLGISDHDSEGRLVTAEFDSFYLLSGYVPNSGDGLKRLSYRVTQWDPSLSSYMKELEKSKPVILTGDLNCAHQEIDIFNPAGNRRSAGFTDEERQSFEINFLSKGFIDTFRRQHPGVVGYTYWGYRHGARKTNRGWRLDYFLASESIADQVHDSYILPDVSGSDHCPIGIVLKL
ncbi:hypothetical protein Ancab_013864 [Ancistrocladus abbreviatus]